MSTQSPELPDAGRVLASALSPFNSAAAQLSAALEDEHLHDMPQLAALAGLRHRECTYRRGLALADASASLLAVLIVVWSAGLNVTLAAVAVPFIAVLIAKVEGLYDRDDQVIVKTNLVEWRTVLQANVLMTITFYLGWRVLTTTRVDGGMRIFGSLAVVSFLLSVVFRGCARRTARRLAPAERCLVVGNADRLTAVRQRLEVLDGVELVGMVSEAELTGSVHELCGLVERLTVHRLVIAHSHEPDNRTLRLIEAAKFLGVRVSLVPSVMTAVGGFAVIEELDGLTMLGVPRFGLTRSSSALKRTFDVVAGSLALLVLSPLMVIIAAAVKLDSPGPVLFRQVRVGRGGRPFSIVKFRSMLDGAEARKAQLMALNEAGEGLFKMRDDPRVTRVGHLIRSTHLDELPQLLNVLKGEMSLVGPRPLVLEEDSRVTGRDRHRVKLVPGMTGPWQLKGPLHTPLSEMAKLDYRYASAWSIWQDLDILIRTVSRVFKRGGH